MTQHFHKVTSIIIIVISLITTDRNNTLRNEAMRMLCGLSRDCQPVPRFHSYVLFPEAPLDVCMSNAVLELEDGGLSLDVSSSDDVMVLEDGRLSSNVG